MSFQQCRFNFGSEPFKYPPKSRSFDSFNSHAYLKEQDKIVLPRHLFLEQLRKMSVHEDSCTLCFDAKGNVRLEPCKHRWDNRIDFLSSASPLSTKDFPIKHFSGVFVWHVHLSCNNAHYVVPRSRQLSWKKVKHQRQQLMKYSRDTICYKPVNNNICIHIKTGPLNCSKWATSHHKW